MFTAGNFSALNAVWINRVVIGWLAWELTGLASWVGLMSLFLFAPTIVASPLFGVILDRVDLRRAAILSQLVLIVAMTILLVLLMAGQLTIWLLSPVAIVIGITSSADRTIRFLLVPGIVEKAALANAVAIHGVSFNTARLIGPAFGGVMISAMGTDVTVAINVAMILPFLIMLLRLRLRDREMPRAARQPFFAEIADGIRYVFDHPLIRHALLLTALYSLSVRGALEILPVIADGEFHRGADGLGVMLAGGGAGALCGALLIALRRAPANEVSIAAYVEIVIGIVATAFLGITGQWWVAVGIVFLLGFCSTAIAIDLQTTVQLSLSDAFRGRVMSMWVMIVLGGSAMNAIALGFFADIFGMMATLVGAALVAAACFVAVTFGRFRRPDA